MSLFGTRLKELREDREIMSKDFAKIMNVEPSTVTNWEKGNRFPKEDVIIKLADYFNVSVDYLFGRTDDPNTEVVNITYGDKPLTFKLAKGTKKELSQEDIQKMIDKLEAFGMDMETFIEKLKE
ncbi:helix-turn-helix domain-containing protein [Clostridium sp.]|uniref:helix-turn-helix domain-containing protein n=1 Tax=Clostridium sp. TaxID=1506 RepID=UPI0039957694